MHEVSVAASIFDIVQRHVPASEARRVRAVRVRVGEISGVVCDSLDFCFGAMVAGTPFVSAFLAIERVPARGRCGDCGRVIEVLNLPFTCQACASMAVTIISGDELQIVDVELDDTIEVAS